MAAGTAGRPARNISKNCGDESAENGQNADFAVLVIFCGDIWLFAVPAGYHGSDLSAFVNLQKNTPRFLCKLLPDSAFFVGCYESAVLFLSHPAIAFSEEKGYNNKVCLPADMHRNQIRRTAADQILTRYGEWSL